MKRQSISILTYITIFLAFLLGMAVVKIEKLSSSKNKKEQEIIHLDHKVEHDDNRQSARIPDIAIDTTVYPPVQRTVPTVLKDPYAPPLKSEGALRAVPVNVPTQAGQWQFRQVGIAKAKDGKGPYALMGKQLISSKDTWQYYLLSDQFNQLKLPVYSKGRDCMDEYGCDGLYSGDNITAPGVDGSLDIDIYRSAYPQYIPYLY